MVVLAVAITAKTGKLLLSRQYVDMSRIRIEGLLTAFPKLIGTEKQHTYVETSSVRYVYQPVESLYVMLLTTKTSNIVEDLETLRLLAKIVQETSPQYGEVDEGAVMKMAFGLFQSFDEVIDWGGYRENVNLQQVAQFTEMFSNEEILAKRMEEIKVKEATTAMEKQAAVIKQQKGGDDKFGAFGNELGKLMEKTGFGGLATDLGFAGNKRPGGATPGVGGGISSDSYHGGPPGMGGMPGMGGGPGMPGMGSGMGGMGSDMGGMGGGMPGMGSMGMQGANPMGAQSKPAAPSISAGGKGMALGKTKKQDNFLEQMRAEGEMVDILPTMKKPTAQAAGPAMAFAPVTEPVHLTTVEKLTLKMDKDGGVEKLEVKGDLSMLITDAEKAAVRIQVALGDNSKFQLRPHPKIDKTLFSQSSVLGLKGDPSQGFPVGNALEILRWRMSTTDESEVPINVSCWPSEGGNGSQVNLEYELVKSEELRNVVIAIPIPGNQAPTIGQADGEYEFNNRTSTLEWMIPVIDSSNANGVMEFSTGPADSNSFFPVSVNFLSKKTYANIAVSKAVHAGSGEPIKFSQEVSLTTDEFTIM